MKHQSQFRTDLLEPRRHLAAASSISLAENGQLTLLGSNSNNVLAVERIGDFIIAKCDEQFVRFTSDSVISIVANGAGGNDTLDNRTELPSTLLGGSGIDSLLGGSGEDYLDGYGASAGDLEPDGLDILDGRAGNDVYPDDDIYDYTHRAVPIRFFGTYEEPTKLSHTVRVGDNEIDTVYGKGPFWGTRFDDAFIPGDIVDNFEFWGFDGDDYFEAPLRGSGIAYGGNGDDTFWQGVLFNGGVDPPGFAQMASFGEAGDDVVILVQHPGDQAYGSYDLGPGTDSIDLSEYSRGEDAPSSRLFFVRDGQSVERIVNAGRNGPVRVEDGRINDSGPLYIAASATASSPVTLMGGAFNDTLVGSAFADLLDGGSGSDFIDSRGGNDTMSGGFGNDTILAGNGHDRVDGGGGNDQLQGEGGNDTLAGNSGNDNLHGGSGADRLFGGSGNDTIDGGGGRDLLDGQTGNDILYAKDGLIDTLFGGAGFDRARRDHTSTVRDLVDGVEAFV